MDPLKDTRWQQKFENFEKAYKLLEKYSKEEITTEIEKAGIIQFFEMTFELAWKVLKDYLEAQGFIVKSPRETIKLAFQNGIIEEGHVWIEALTKKNLTIHTYDEAFADKFVKEIKEIKEIYFPIFKSLYDRLSGVRLYVWINRT